MIGKETILSTLGPMAQDRDSLELFMKVVLDAQPWRLDPSLTAKVWTPYHFTKPLKIAVQWWDGVVKPHPPMIRALKEVSEACMSAGMKVVEWDSEKLNHRKGWDILSALYWTDGGAEVLGRLVEAGEPVLPLTKFIIQEQPTVKNLTQHELWEVCHLRFLSDKQLLIFYSCARKETAIVSSMLGIGLKQPTKTDKKSMSSFVLHHLVQQHPMSSLATGVTRQTGISWTTLVWYSQSPLWTHRRTRKMKATCRRMQKTSSSTRCTLQRYSETRRSVYKSSDEDSMTRRSLLLLLRSKRPWAENSKGTVSMKREKVVSLRRDGFYGKRLVAKVPYFTTLW